MLNLTVSDINTEPGTNLLRKILRFYTGDSKLLSIFCIDLYSGEDVYPDTPLRSPLLKREDKIAWVVDFVTTKYMHHRLYCFDRNCHIMSYSCD